jgi:hypothetical protein
MNSRRPLLTLGVSTLFLALPIAAVVPSGCGNYESDPVTGGAAGMGGSTGGAGGSTGGMAPGVGGSAAGVGGAGGSTGGTGAGGMAPVTGGAAGSAQAGTGTSAGGMPSSGGMATSGTSGGAGEGGEASCDEVAPCGGDVVGAWTVASCPLTVSGDVNMMGFGLDCKTAPITSGTLEVSGTVEFLADGSFTDHTITTGTSMLELPELCKHVSGTTTDCVSLGESLDSLGYKSAVCTDNTTTMGCTCTTVTEQMGGLVFVSPDFSDNGLYKTADNKLTTTVFGIDTEYPYCVAGNTLTMTLATVSKTGPVTGPIVLQK